MATVRIKVAVRIYFLLYHIYAVSRTLYLLAFLLSRNFDHCTVLQVDDIQLTVYQVHREYDLFVISFFLRELHDQLDIILIFLLSK